MLLMERLQKSIARKIVNTTDFFLLNSDRPLTFERTKEKRRLPFRCGRRDTKEENRTNISKVLLNVSGNT